MLDLNGVHQKRLKLRLDYMQTTVDRSDSWSFDEVDHTAFSLSLRFIAISPIDFWNY